MTISGTNLSTAKLPERVRLERDRHVAFAFAAADLLIEASIDSTIIAASGAVQAVLGVSVNDLIGRRVAEIVASADQLLVCRLLKQLQQLGRIDPAVIRLARANKAPIRILFGGCRLPNAARSVFLTATLLPSALVAVPRPHDEETGLLTADALREAAQRTSGDNGSGARQLELVRLEGLSGAVRQLPAGRASMLMQEIGASLRALSIGGDAAGRLGEDSFGIVTKIAQNSIRNSTLVTELSAAIRAAGIPDGQVGPRLASIDLSADTLSDGEAGRALTYAMNNFVHARGIDFTISSLQDGLTAAINDTVSRFSKTRRMIENGDFVLVYQPVTDISTRVIHHYEALSRFPGKADTFETVGFMEDVGLVAELDLAVCRLAIEALEENPNVKLAVNLSGRSIQDAAFRNALSGLIKPIVDLRHRLLFELTESAAVVDLEGAAAYLGWLRKLGHMICLDDFGAGAAAYSYLRRFDVDFVKIDGPFLKAAVDHGRERALIRSICVLCQEIGCKIIGEMIEDEAGVSLAMILGIEYGQGWLFGKPVQTLPKLVRAGRRKGVVEIWE